MLLHISTDSPVSAAADWSTIESFEDLNRDDLGMLKWILIQWKLILTSHLPVSCKSVTQSRAYAS